MNCNTTHYRANSSSVPGDPTPHCIGARFGYTAAYVLDARLEPCAPGVAGELFLGGATIARGYWNRPELTAERFVRDPFAADASARLYRTGDLVRLLHDGQIEFLGRADDQVKIRGFRIELGEVEAALAAHASVDSAVVVAREDAPGRKRLVAYVTAGDAAPEAEALAAHLAARLPDYMVPAQFVVLDALPLNANGKVDRRRLPAPPLADAREAFVAPAGATELALAALWGELLGVARVGAHDNFFALGGQSLLAARLASAIRKRWAIDFPVRAVFEAQRLAALARAIDAACATPAAADAEIARAPEAPHHPLSSAQRRLWLHARLEPRSTAYNIPVALELAGPLDADALERALARLVQRHAILRTRYAEIDGEAVQIVEPAADIALARADLRDIEPAAQAERLRALARRDADTPFDLACVPQLRARLVALAPERHALLLVAHHVAADGSSFGVMIDELDALMRDEPALPDPALQYADFAHHERHAPDDAARLDYWRSRLAGLPEGHDLPLDRPRAKRRDESGATLARALDGALLARLAHVAHAHDATLFMLLHAAFAALLSRWSGAADVAIGTPVANREHPGLAKLVGCLVNTVVLRSEIDAACGFDALLAQSRARTLEALEHQALPFDRVVAELAPQRDGAQHPLFQVLFSFEASASRTLPCSGLALRWLEPAYGSAKFDLSLYARAHDGGLALVFEYATALFDTASIARLADAMTRVLETVAREPRTTIAALPLLDHAGSRLVLDAGCGAAVDFPHDACMHELIAAQAARTPDATALVCEDQRLSYAELERRANRLARALRDRGVGADAPVGLCCERSVEMVVGILAILKAGGAYVPLDPDQPRARLAAMLDGSGIELVLHQRRLRDRLPDGAYAVLALDDPDLALLLAPYDDGPLARAAGQDATSLAYVIFTSGSTGMPKGVMMEHRALVNRIDWMQREYGIGADDVVLQKTPYSFDVSVWEFCWTLATGACLVMARPDGHRDPAYLEQAIRAHGVTTLHFVPSMLRAMLDGADWSACASVRRVFASGEALPKDLERAFFATGTGAALHNLYGPTEAAIDVSYWECRRDCARATVPIGRAIQNVTLRVLDARGTPQPFGVAGELCIGGVALARGYLARPDLTAERFVELELGGARERLYRTGDLVRQLPDGVIEYLGRIDHQVKIRGFRIELGEIESRLLHLPEVRDAVVVARELGGDRQLVAYVAADAHTDLDAVRAALALALPAYMIPAAFVRLDALPLSANGKIDRKALPAPRLGSVSHVEPATATEVALAVIWRELLRIESVGADSGFFAVGGHSLLATRLASRIRARWQVDLALESVFEHQTLRALAAAIDAAPALVEAPIAASDRALPQPLSFAQQRFWLMDQLEPGSARNTMSGAFALEGELPHALLERTMQALVERHAILRTGYALVGGAPRQLARAHVGLTLPLTLLDALEPAEQDAAVRELARAEAARPFDLAHDDMLRAQLLRLAPRRHVLLVSLHHIASDGWSNGILARDIERIFAALAAGEQPAPKLTPIEYADFAAWERGRLSGARLERTLDWWTRRLAGAPLVHALPLDRPRAARATHRGAVHAQRIDAALATRLRALARQHDATLFMVLHAAFAALLARFSGALDLVVGTTHANRAREELADVVGLFMNPLALRSDLSGDPRFDQILRQSRDRALDAFARADVPFEPLLEALAVPRSEAYAPLIQVMLILQNNADGGLRLPGVESRALAHDHTHARLDLILDAFERDDALEIAWEFATDLFEPASIARMAAHFEQLLRAVCAAPATRLAAIPLWAPAVLNDALASWRGPALGHPTWQCLHELVEANAQSAPDAIAVVDGERRISYGELDARATRVARRLRDSGVAADRPVGVLVERSIEMAVAFLGVLKAGGAYLPLNPELPEARLDAILEAASACCVLTRASERPALPPRARALPVFDLDVLDDHDLALAAHAQRLARVAPCDAAYLIFTSGSTGAPKGVVVEHRAIVSSFHAWRSLYRLDQGTANHLQMASIGFDVCVGDMVRALCSGGKLVICPKETLLDAPALHALIERERIHCAEFVPLSLRHLVTHLDRAGLALPTLKFLIAGSDAWHGEDLAATWRVVGDDCVVANSYGLTEAAVDSTCFLSRRGDRAPEGATVPIGRPLGNVEALVLDAALQPCPIGVPGELYIGGPALARGYLDPALTAERFVADPFGRPGVRLYRTGDLARWRADGQLEHLGRIDHQVKVRGFRIEPGEIEAVLRTLPAVREAVVVDFRTQTGETQLAAYFTAHAGAGEDATLRRALRAALAARLPDYMVPAALVRLERLPANANGKVDRAALPPVALDLDDGFVAPATPTEHALAALWQELLGLDRVGVDSSFFHLGGHSLLAARLVALAAERFAVELPIRAVFEHPTVRGLAARIEQAAARAAAPIARVARDVPLPLSFAQQRLWLVDQLEPGSAQYNIATALRLRGALDRVALRGALDRIVERHEILRTTYATRDGEPAQVVHAAAPLALPLVELASEAELQACARAEAARPFDLARDPMLRATLVRLGDTEHVLLLSMHHIAADGWSMGLLTNELCAAYRARATGAPEALPVLEVQYADYAQWQRAQLTAAAEAAHLDYWRAQLAGIPALHELPLDRARPARQSHRGATLTTTLAPSKLAALHALARAHDATLFNVLHTALAALIARASGADDVVVGTPVANREREAVAPLVGFFVNTLVLRSTHAPEASFASLLRQARAALLDALEHQALPFERLVDALAPARSASHHPLFQVLLVLQNNALGDAALPGLETAVFRPETDVAKFDLTLDVLERPEGAYLAWEYATDLFDAASIARLAQLFERLLDAVVAAPDARLAALDLGARGEHATPAASARTETLPLVHEHLQRTAMRTPHHPAVVHGARSLDYAGLARRASRLARELVALGVRPDSVVGIALGRSIELVVAVAAVLESGGAFVALDPALPSARLRHMLDDAHVAVVLTSRALVDTLPETGAFVVALDDREVAEAIERQYADPITPLEIGLGPAHLAYLIYTSGTTGEPKAVQQCHRTLAHLVLAQQRDGLLGRPLTTLQFAALSFDVAIQEIATAWETGATLALVDADERMDPACVIERIRAMDVGRAFLPPAMFNAIADEWLQQGEPDLACLREVVCAGEALTIGAAVGRLVAKHGVRVLNHYGPSETHVVTHHEVLDFAPGAQPPIGTPLGAHRLYVLDAATLAPQPAGLPGELFVAGPGLARGYLGRATLTAERFVADPFVAGAPMYRTGDRVRVRPDGSLQFLGRADQQLKVRGYRVEPGEIEHALRAHELVRDAVVVARDDASGAKRLVAYVVGDTAVGRDTLAAHLAARLPEHMVPAAFVAIESIPLNRNGKLDRSRLPEPDFGAGAAHAQPRTALERALLPLWQAVLDVATLGVEENFFAAGGHSLLAVKLVARIRAALGRPLALRTLLEAPTVAALARRIEQDSPGAAEVGPLHEDPTNAHAPFPLTDIQQAYRLGRTGHFELGNIGTHSYIEIPAEGLELPRLERAWNALIRRHPMLRMVLTPDGEQRILAEVPDYAIEVQDCAAQSEPDAESARLALRERMSHQVFSGEQWPLFEIRATRLSADRLVLHLSIDALALDAASTIQLSRELMQLYAEPARELEPLAISFRDYVISERRLRESGFVDAARAYWHARLDEFPAAPELPLACDPGSIASPYFEGRAFKLEPVRWDALKAHAARAKVTPTIAVLGAFAQTLALWSRRARFALNLTLFNRIEFHPQVDLIVGDFTSLTLLEVDLEDATRAFGARLEAIQQRLWSDLEHKAYTGVEVQRELSRRGGRTVGFPVVVTSTLGIGNQSDAESPFRRDELYTVSQTPQVWLDFQVSEIDGALSCNWDSVQGLFPAGMLDAMFESFCGLLSRLALEESAWDAVDLDLLPRADRALIDAANDTACELGGGRLHQPLLEQIPRQCDRTAIVAERRVSYRELGVASQRLRDRLSREAAPTLPSPAARERELVAVVMDKGWEQVVAVLAILRADAAYLPIDASLPPERIAALLEIGDVRQVVTTPNVAAKLDLSNFSVEPIDATLLSNVGDVELELEAPRQAETDLAYVIFTSGSTGTPKGVMIDHRGALNTILDVNARYAVGPEDAVLGLSSLSFDLSVYDIFGVLGAGGTLVLPRPEDQRDPAAWLPLIERERVSLWNTVPALMQMLVDYAQDKPLPLRTVLMSGDWIPTDLPARIRALAPEAALISLGGATEASIWSIEHVIGAVDPDWKSIPYGKALANQSFHVLKADLEPAPVHAIGELYIGGVGLAVGYWRDQARTAERFVTHPRTKERLYRTGDLGRLMPDGDIEFLGREDQQVKVQGYRIELGEIEARLKAHPQVKDAVVGTFDVGRTKQLVAYVVPAETDADTLEVGVSDPDVMTDRLARREFVAAQHALRDDFDARHGVPVERVAALVPLLEPLRAHRVDGLPLPKRRYPSAGSLYPVQAYLIANGLGGLDDGAYYYDPSNHALQQTLRGADGPTRLVLAADLAAIAPMYGALGADFSALEAGYVAQLLRAAAPAGLAPRRVELAGDETDAIGLGATHRPLAAYALEPAPRSGTATPLPPVVARKSYRRFEPAGIAHASFAPMLAALADAEATGAELQVWFWIRESRVEGHAGGLHRLHLATRTLVAIDEPLDAAAVFRLSTPILDQAAFAFFVCGPARTPDALLRAGLLTQAATDTALAHEIGLCAIGIVDEPPALRAFGLDGAAILTSLLGGAITPAQIESVEISTAPAVDPVLELQRFLGRTLPAYMVPGQFVALAAIPLSANGKVDRKALPAPSAAPAPKSGYAAPESGIEQALCAIWQDVMGLARVGVDDNFFDCGGDSIRAVTVLTRARKLGIRFSVRDLYTHQTIAALARVATIDDATEAASDEPAAFALLEPETRAALASAIDARAIVDAYPLTQLQQGMVFHNLADGARGTYHDIVSSHLKVRWHEAAFAAALRATTARHEALRTVFRHDLDPPLQLVLASHAPELEIHDLTDLTRSAQTVAIRRWSAAERARAFEPGLPAWKIAIHLRGDEELQYSLVCHHALLDGWSVAQLNAELFAEYAARLNGRAAPAVPPAMPYRHYVAAEIAAARDDAARDHWSRKLVEAPLPWWSGARRSGTVHKRTLEFGGSDFERLAALARSLGVQEKSIFLAAHVGLMGLLGGARDVVTSVVTHCRPAREHAERALGLFLNSLPFRLDTRELSWPELIQAVEREQLEDERFKHYPLARIHAETGLDFAASLFTFVNFHVYGALGGDVVALGDDSVDLTNYAFATEVAKDEAARRFRVVLAVEDGVFDAAACDRIVGYLARIVERILARDNAPIAHAALIGAAERELVLGRFNATARAFPDSARIHELFERQARATPGAVALEFEGRTLSYAELDARANALAHFLLAHGVRANDLVGLCLERSLEMVVAIYGVLKAGAAYVPLDPAYPEARLQLVVRDAAMRFVLTQSAIANAIDFGAAQALALDDGAFVARLRGYPDVAPRAPALPVDEHLAYVIYTSGSTGLPKGVMVAHQALVNRIDWMDAEYRLTRDDVVLQKTPYSFDVSVWEFTWPLVTGARLVIAKPDGHKDPTYLADLIAARGVTTLHFVPSMLRLMLDGNLLEHADWGALSSVRQVFCSGEALPIDLERAFHATGTRAKLHNLYGPTEAAIDVSYFECDGDAARASVPIGRPIQNIALYVLDARLEPVPLGVPGELHIGGVGLARGYLNRPELTAERFVPDPFDADPLARLYKTGDLARHLPDGNIEYLGRIDHQVKIRGFRIELGEVEASLLAHPDVDDAVVVAQGGERLVAYVCSASEQKAHDALIEDVRAHLRRVLPDHMVPAAFVVLERMPLNANGKIDRKALPEPGRAARAEHAPPRDALEAALATIWQELLGVEQVGVHERFFDLGGDSLKLVRLAARIRQRLGADLGVMTLYNAPSVADIAALLREAPGLRPLELLHELTTPRDARATVLAVPYAAGDGVVYQPLAERLPRELALFSVTSPRGFDLDARDGAAFEALVERCVAEALAKISGPILVWGHCVGYALAIVLARRLLAAGADVRALCIGGALVDAEHLEQSRELAQLDGVIGRDDVIGLLGTAGLAAAHGDIADDEWDEIVAKFQQDLWLSGRCNAAHFVADGAPRLPLPLYCVLAADDPLTPGMRERAPNWRLVADRVRVVELDDGGHYFVKTRASEVAAILEGVWGEVSVGSVDLVAD